MTWVVARLTFFLNPVAAIHQHKHPLLAILQLGGYLARSYLPKTCWASGGRWDFGCGSQRLGRKGRLLRLAAALLRQFNRTGGKIEEQKNERLTGLAENTDSRPCGCCWCCWCCWCCCCDGCCCWSMCTVRCRRFTVVPAANRMVRDPCLHTCMGVAVHKQSTSPLLSIGQVLSHQVTLVTNPSSIPAAGCQSSLNESSQFNLQSYTYYLGTVNQAQHCTVYTTVTLLKLPLRDSGHTM